MTCDAGDLVTSMAGATTSTSAVSSSPAMLPSSSVAVTNTMLVKSAVTPASEHSYSTKVPAATTPKTRSQPGASGSVTVTPVRSWSLGFDTMIVKSAVPPSSTVWRSGDFSMVNAPGRA